MKFTLKHFSFAGYLRHLRRQNKHIQQVHAVIFAAVITGLIASIVLYVDYGFWHEKYVREAVVNATTTEPVAESPSEALGRFWSEARVHFSNIGSSSASLLEGKEVYTK